MEKTGGSDYLTGIVYPPDPVDLHATLAPGSIRSTRTIYSFSTREASFHMVKFARR